MQKFSKSFINMDMDDEQLKLVVVAALNNELKLYFNDTVDEFEPRIVRRKENSFMITEMFCIMLLY